jgi:hypothetical protein
MENIMKCAVYVWGWITKQPILVNTTLNYHNGNSHFEYFVWHLWQSWLFAVMCFSAVWVTRTVWSCINITMVVLCMLFCNLNMVRFLQEDMPRSVKVSSPQWLFTEKSTTVWCAVNKKEGWHCRGNEYFIGLGSAIKQCACVTEALYLFCQLKN